MIFLNSSFIRIELIFRTHQKKPLKDFVVFILNKLYKTMFKVKWAFGSFKNKFFEEKEHRWFTAMFFVWAITTMIILLCLYFDNTDENVYYIYSAKYVPHSGSSFASSPTDRETFAGSVANSHFILLKLVTQERKWRKIHRSFAIKSVKSLAKTKTAPQNTHKKTTEYSQKSYSKIISLTMISVFSVKIPFNSRIKVDLYHDRFPGFHRLWDWPWNYLIK